MAVFGFDEKTTHVGFTDESTWSERVLNFRSITCVSARVEHYCEIESRLYAARCRAGAKMAELKWNPKIRGRKEWQKHRRDATYTLQTALELAVEKKLRIDVVVWDKRDRSFLAQRHNIQNKEDLWHLKNMYRTLIADVIHRWQSSEGLRTPFWSIAADKLDGMEFSLLQDNLLRFEKRKIGNSNLVIEQEKASPNYSLQLADLFAGMGAFSHNNWGDYEIWLEMNRPSRLSLHAPQWHIRFPILYNFIKDCSSNKMGITLLAKRGGFRGRGLCTQQPFISSHTINFWPYIPRPRRNKLK